MRTKLIAAGLLAASAALVLEACTGANAAATDLLGVNKQDAEYYINRGQTRLTAEQARQAIAAGTAKNVILFIGDGMGVSTVTATRIFNGQLNGVDGESSSLYMESLPYLAMSKTYSSNQQTADSAPTATAMVSGVKTKEGYLSISNTIKKNDAAACDGSKNLGTIAELAESVGMSTGVVSTARITHATPASTYAHTPNRDAEDDTTLASQVSSGNLSAASGCTDIATQLVNFGQNIGDGSGFEVALGGGRKFFFPKPVNAASVQPAEKDVEGKTGSRSDSVDLRNTWRTRYTSLNGSVAETRDQLLAVDPATTDHLLGLFNSSHMDYETDRISAVGDVKADPSLAEMTEKAIKILQKNTKGYFLMVEGGRIDHAHHAGNAYRAFKDAIAFDQAIKVADDLTSDNDTLIIVTADHSHTMTIGGYPFRNNPILGLVTEASPQTGDVSSSPATDLFGKTYTTISYANGLGFGANVPAESNPKSSLTDTSKGSLQNPRADLTGVDTTDKNYHQEALVALASETHAGEDVMIFAKGPGGHLFRGVVEQSYIFHVMKQAANLLVSK